MDEEEFIKPKNNIELGSNLDVLSVDELSEYIKNLQGEINRVKKDSVFTGNKNAATTAYNKVLNSFKTNN
jgi:uncharacterized small protein (DUF1192 family)